MKIVCGRTGIITELLRQSGEIVSLGDPIATVGSDLELRRLRLNVLAKSIELTEKRLAPPEVDRRLSMLRERAELAARAQSFRQLDEETTELKRSIGLADNLDVAFAVMQTSAARVDVTGSGDVMEMYVRAIEEGRLQLDELKRAYQHQHDLLENCLESATVRALATGTLRLNCYVGAFVKSGQAVGEVG